VVLPTLLAALGEDDRATPAGVVSLQEAAQEAVRAAGTEVSAPRGSAGRAQLRRHPWFGERRTWFGHKATVPSGRPAAGAVGWTPADQ
jgi:hypothetical protein